MCPKNNDEVSRGSVYKYTKCITLNVVPLNFRSSTIIFQQVGALPHISKHFMEILSATFPGRWTGKVVQFCGHLGALI
jgi:hypothetical protein